MNKITSTDVCPAKWAGGLDIGIRKWVHNPRKIFTPYITPDMKILDLGCGPGFFSMELAQMLNEQGHITALDLQQGMLDRVKKKVIGTSLEDKITLHKCDKDSLNLIGKFDFAFSFWVIHEIPDKERLFSELKSVMKPNGKVLIVEPRVHTTKKYFAELLEIINHVGFELIGTPEIFFSRSLLLA